MAVIGCQRKPVGLLSGSAANAEQRHLPRHTKVVGMKGRVYLGAWGPTGWGQAEPRADAASAWGCVARLVQLNPPVKGL